jgi:hypothetical protein
MALANHNLSSESLKNDFVEFHEAMIHGDKRPRELVFCIQGLKKET